MVHAIHAAGHSPKVQRSLSAAGLCHSSHCWWNAARAAELKDIDDNSMMGCIHMIPYVSDVIRIVLELSTFQAAHPSKAVKRKDSETRSRCREHFQETLSNIYRLVTSTVATSSTVTTWFPDNFSQTNEIGAEVQHDPEYFQLAVQWFCHGW